MKKSILKKLGFATEEEFKEALKKGDVDIDSVIEALPEPKVVDDEIMKDSDNKLKELQEKVKAYSDLANLLKVLDFDPTDTKSIGTFIRDARNRNVDDSEKLNLTIKELTNKISQLETDLSNEKSISKKKQGELTEKLNKAQEDLGLKSKEFDSHVFDTKFNRLAENKLVIDSELLAKHFSSSEFMQKDGKYYKVDSEGNILKNDTGDLIELESAMDSFLDKNKMFLKSTRKSGLGTEDNKKRDGAAGLSTEDEESDELKATRKAIEEGDIDYIIKHRAAVKNAVSSGAVSSVVKNNDDEDE